MNQAEDDKWTALMFAAFRGDIQTVVTLMNAGADPTRVNKLGATAMDMARREGHTAIIEIITSYTSNKNLRTRVIH